MQQLVLDTATPTRQLHLHTMLTKEAASAVLFAERCPLPAPSMYARSYSIACCACVDWKSIIPLQCPHRKSMQQGSTKLRATAFCNRLLATQKYFQRQQPNGISPLLLYFLQGTPRALACKPGLVASCTTPLGHLHTVHEIEDLTSSTTDPLGQRLS